jgi:hypothetical protein
MFVVFVHTGEEPVHRLLAKMSTSSVNLTSPTFLAKILELVSTNSYNVPLQYLLYILSEQCIVFVNMLHL